MKDSYSFDIDDDGLKDAYHAHREAYQQIFARLARRLRHRLGDLGRDGRQRVGGVPGRERDRRGHLRALPRIRLRRQRRGRDHRARRRRCRSTDAPAPVVHDTPDTPTIATLVDWANGALGREVTAADTLKNVLVKIRQPGRRVGAAGGRRARRPRGRREAPGGRARTGRVRAARRGRLRQATRSWSRATSARRRCRPTEFASSSTRGWSTARLDHRRRRAGQARRRPGRRARLHPGRHHRGRRGARRRPVARRRRAAGRRRAASRSATSSSSAASTPTRSPSTCSARTASRCG